MTPRLVGEFASDFRTPFDRSIGDIKNAKTGGQPRPRKPLLPIQKDKDRFDLGSNRAEISRGVKAPRKWPQLFRINDFLWREDNTIRTDRVIDEASPTAFQR
jgi:hypothetical protein